MTSNPEVYEKFLGRHLMELEINSCDENCCFCNKDRYIHILIKKINNKIYHCCKPCAKIFKLIIINQLEGFIPTSEDLYNDGICELCNLNNTFPYCGFCICANCFNIFKEIIFQEED